MDFLPSLCKEALLEKLAGMCLRVEGTAMMYKTLPLMGLQGMSMDMPPDSPMTANHWSLLPTLGKLLGRDIIKWAIAL